MHLNSLILCLDTSLQHGLRETNRVTEDELPAVEGNVQLVPQNLHRCVTDGFKRQALGLR